MEEGKPVGDQFGDNGKCHHNNDAETCEECSREFLAFAKGDINRRVDDYLGKEEAGGVDGAKDSTVADESNEVPKPEGK